MEWCCVSLGVVGWNVHLASSCLRARATGFEALACWLPRAARVSWLRGPVLVARGSVRLGSYTNFFLEKPGSGATYEPLSEVLRLGFPDHNQVAACMERLLALRGTSRACKCVKAGLERNEASESTCISWELYGSKLRDRRRLEGTSEH